MLYKNLAVNEAGHLTFGGYDTTDLAAQFGTPLMVMDEAVIRNRCREYKAAVAAYFPAGSMPLYASKALSLKRIYEIMQQEQMGIDVVSSGELFTAVRGGFPMENAYFHGNSKTDADIAFAMEHGLGCFVCDNEDELNAINAEAGKRGIRQKILLRLTPGIDPHTHEKINTGRIDCKFGAAIETGQAEALILNALSKENIELRGSHFIQFSNTGRPVSQTVYRTPLPPKVTAGTIPGASRSIGTLGHKGCTGHTVDKPVTAQCTLICKRKIKPFLADIKDAVC